MANDDSDHSGQIPTNLRLLVLLEEVVRAGVPVTPTAVNDVLRLPKPTIHRLFATAEAEGFLQRDIDGRSFSPGRRLRQMAVGTLTSERVRTARLAILSALAGKVGETCNIAIPEREGMFYLDRVETHWPLRIQLPVGTQVPILDRNDRLVSTLSIHSAEQRHDLPALLGHMGALRAAAADLTTMGNR